jgi:surfeit locus 1 family protein
MSRLRPLLVPAILTAVVCALLIALGCWQLHRLAWKEEILSRIEARTKAPPQSLPPISTWKGLSPADYDYRRVALDGTFDHAHEAYVFHGSEEGPGYLVLTPLRLTTGGTVLVNRGFVPEALREPANRQAGAPRGLVHVVGLMRPPEGRNLFTPADEPAKAQWFTRDPAAIAAAEGLERAAPFTIDADASAIPGGLPQGGETVLDVPNNHLSYALTWFGLAAGLAAVFAAFALRRLRGSDP